MLCRAYGMLKRDTYALPHDCEHLRAQIDIAANVHEITHVWTRSDMDGGTHENALVTRCAIYVKRPSSASCR